MHVPNTRSVLLRESTLAEMRAGAEAVAKEAGVEFNEEYFEAARDMLARHTTMHEWQRRKLIRIVRDTEAGKRIDPVVYVGKTAFPDPLGYGSWPSALLVAQVALAIEGGMHLEKDE